MDKRHHFPFIMVKKVLDGFEAVAGLKLSSILKYDLLEGAWDDGEHKNPARLSGSPEKLKNAREALVQAVSSWPEHTTLELRMAASPDLANKARSKISFTLFLRVFASSGDDAREETAARFLSLRPILSAHWSEADFIPVTRQKELKHVLNPFKPASAVAVSRRKTVMSLSAPLKKLSLGFGPMELREVGEGSMVNHLFPWVPSGDDWARLTDTLIGQLDPVQIILRIRPAGAEEELEMELPKTVRTCERYLERLGNHQPTLHRQVALIRDVALEHLTQVRGNAFHAGVFVLSPSSRIDTSLVNVLGAAITQMGGNGQEKTLFRGGFNTVELAVKEAVDGQFFPESSPFSVSESAAAFRLPSPPKEGRPGLPVRRFRTSFALLSGESVTEHEKLHLAVNEHLGLTQPVFMGTEDRMRHTFIVGQTGTGKSTLMESMILHDIRAGKGMALIDPHGELVEAILGKIPRKREKDVILFDMMERERPCGFNLLEWKTIEERDLIIDELYLTLDRIYDMKQTGGPIFESNFRGMLKLLMGENPREDYVPTILEFTTCYLEEDFREWLKERSNDPQAIDFANEIERTVGEASVQNLSPYVTSKFSRFVHDSGLRRIIGQERTSFDFEEIMNNKKIFLVNLGKGRFGSVAGALLANQLVSRFKLAAMKRANMKPEERKAFYLYVDEAHNLPPENFQELLSEARKYRMGLILATQYTAQLQDEGMKGRGLLSAILGNVGTLLILRLGYEDAMKLAPTLYPIFTSTDIVGLPNWQGYAKTQLNGEATPPFSFKTLRDPAPFNPKTAARIRKLSKKRYGLDVNTIDKKAAKRRVIWKEGSGH